MASKFNGILALPSPSPLAVLGWQTIRNRQQLRNQNACRRLKNRSLCQQWTYARPQKILKLQEFYHPRYTPGNCVSEESTDSSAKSVAQINFYMGDDNKFEEEIEEPAKYVPPPPLNHEDAEMIGKTEIVLYTMKDFLCCLLKKQEADWKNCEKVWKLFSRTVEFQDPLICFRGIKSLIWWLEAVRDAVILVDVDINEIYSVIEAKAKPQIYIIWTVALTKDQQESFVNLGRQDWWSEEYRALLQHLHNQKEISKNTCQSFLANGNLKERGQDSSPCLDDNGDIQEHSSRFFGLSVETKLEVNSLGEIDSIHTSWHSLRDEPE
jgi:hypothetical protein